MSASHAAPVSAPQHLVTPQQSLMRGLLITSAAAIIPAAVFAYSVNWVSGYFSAAVAAGIGLPIMFKLLHDGVGPRNRVAYGNAAVETAFGDHPTGRLLGPGQHFGLPGINGAKPVDMRERTWNPGPIIDLAGGDNVEVQADAFFLSEAFDPVRVLNVDDANKALLLFFAAEIRFFINQLKMAEDAIDLKDELATLLMLKPKSEDPVGHRQLRKVLMADKDKFVGGKDGVNSILDKAGHFYCEARDRGIRLTHIDVEYFDLPKARKDAAADKANQADVMAAKVKLNKTRKKMVSDLVSSGVDANNALNSVDMTLLDKGTVTKKVEERTIGIQNLDPSKVVNELLKPLAQAAAKRIDPTNTK